MAKQKFFPRFGLNAAVTLKRYEIKEGSNGKYLNFEFEINDKPFWQNLGRADFAWVNGEKSTDPKDVKKRNDEIKVQMRHPVEALVGKKKVDKAIQEAGPTSFEAYAQTLVDLLPEDYQKEKLDVFLEWQWKTAEGQKKTYLQLPNSTKHGDWCVKHQGFGYKWVLQQDYEKEDNDVLKFVNKEGEEHPFKRSGWYMQSHYANRQGVQTVEKKKEPVTAEDDDIPF